MTPRRGSLLLLVASLAELASHLRIEERELEAGGTEAA